MHTFMQKKNLQTIVIRLRYLFAIYVNDIFFVADTLKYVLYADDTALVVTG